MSGMIVAACTLMMGGTPRPALAQCPTISPAFTVTGDVCGVQLSWETIPANATSLTILRSADAVVAHATEIATIVPLGIIHIWPHSSPDLPPLRDVDYHYWIRANGAAGCASAPVFPPQPIQLVARWPSFDPSPAPSAQVQCDSVILNWVLPAGATGVDIWRKDTLAGTRLRLTTVGAPTSTYTDTTGVPGREYEYTALIKISCSSVAQTALHGNPATVVFEGAPTITAQPPSQVVLSHNDAVFQFLVSGAYGSFTWYKDGVVLHDTGVHIIATDTNTMAVLGVTQEDIGTYWCTRATDCGTVTSAPAVLAVRERCPGDFNDSDTVEVADIFRFLNAWFAGCQ
jgi:hypothetical protein